MPRAQVRLVIHPLRFNRKDVRDEDVIGASLEQVGDVPVSNDNREARFGDNAVETRLDDSLVGRVRKHHP